MCVRLDKQTFRMSVRPGKRPRQCKTKHVLTLGYAGHLVQHQTRYPPQHAPLHVCRRRWDWKGMIFEVLRQWQGTRSVTPGVNGPWNVDAPFVVYRAFVINCKNA